MPWSISNSLSNRMNTHGKMHACMLSHSDASVPGTAMDGELLQLPLSMDSYRARNTGVGLLGMPSSKATKIDLKHDTE